MPEPAVHSELVDFAYPEALAHFEAALHGTHPTPNANAIVKVCLQLGELLLRKNAAYGDSALRPMSVFAKNISAVDKLGVRLDDKLSRLSRGKPDGEDPEFDLMGYLVLRRIAAAEEA